MADKLIRGKAVKGDAVYGDYTFPEQRPMSELIAQADELFAKGALAIAWRQDHDVWNDDTYSDFEIHDMMVTKDPKIAESWTQNQFHHIGDEYYDDDHFFPGSYHVEGLTRDEFRDFITTQYEHTVIEHFGKNAVIVITPEDVYRFDYEGGY